MVSKNDVARAMRPKTVRKRGEPKALGECATCTNQAAPWYQCHECRFKNKVGRITREFAKHGVTTRTKDKRDKRQWLHFHVDNDGTAFEELIAKSKGDPKDDDRRLLPKVGKMPADMLATVTNILIEKGSPATEDEICLAWAKLKSERSSSLVADISTIIAAQRKRQRRLGK